MVSKLLCCIAPTFEDVSDSFTAEDVLDSNTHFSGDLYMTLRKSHPENLICSPLSVSAVLAMLNIGARGETAQQIQKVFHFPRDDKLSIGYKGLLESLKSTENFTLDIANNVYAMVGFELNPSYVKVLTSCFGVKIEQLNFANSEASAEQINNWVEEITHERIKNLIDPDSLDDLTRLVLVNGIYFKGTWVKQFDPKNTIPAKFHVTSRNSIMVDMMQITEYFPYAEINDLDAKAVAIPYKGDQLSMIIILPNKQNGLSDLEEKLQKYDSTRLVPILKTEKVVLKMPKFRLESKINLKQPLIKLGLFSIFSEKNANFSGIPKSQCEEGLFVSTAVQKAFIEVNEEGSEAAAATGVSMRVRSLSKPIESIKELNADHPFMFGIWTKSEEGDNGTWLFIGNVRKPQEAAK